ncbi:hypothetical protein CFIMG_008409RA00001 [Ceratocystis fimbriata CBS 114723]|uniref:Zn(2)-C6 fungal-type domain-containing protein n=1 Tax=Ceratocystis fimbriata CBS 114723 TaxID=1035309 RepID=A0A2C5WYG6_9PEZI|nr:hypothetical protein CFIMG_008409RA00001 [Ceratocystis fimbriata CBS 114723]
MANPSRHGLGHDRCLSSSSPSQCAHSGSSSPVSFASPSQSEQHQSPLSWQHTAPHQHSHHQQPQQPQQPQPQYQYHQHQHQHPRPHPHHSQYYQRRPMGPYSPPPLSARSSSSSLRPSASADKQTHYGHLDSCDVCFDDNFKCDRRKPQCSRCVSLNFACHYNQRPLSLHRPQGANVQQRSRQLQHSQHPQPQPNPLGSPLEEAAMLAEINNDLYSSLAHVGLISHESMLTTTSSGERRSQVDEVSRLLGEAMHARNDDSSSIRWPELLQSAEAVVEEAKRHPPQTDVLKQYACPPEIIESWNHLERVCSPNDPCEDKIQKVMPRLSHMYSGIDGDTRDNDTIYRESRETKSWFLQEMKVIMMCSCSNRAKVACRIIIACLSLLTVYHVNIMGLNGRHPSNATPAHSAGGPTSAPTVPASGPGFVPSQRRALAFSTIVLPPLPTQGTSRVNALSTYAALNQHLDTLPDVALPPAARPISPESGSSTRFAPLSNSPVGSPPRSHDRPAAAPARKLSDGFNYPNPQSQNHIFPNYEASRRHVVGDVRLLAELFGSIRFINQVITRYEGALSHIEIPGHRTGYDKAGLEAATRGMSVELKDKLIQVLQDVACLRYPT